MWANHGRTAKYDHDFEGVNSRLDGLQAAILGVKLQRLDAWTERRRRHAYRYNAALDVPGIITPRELENVKAVYHLYVIRVPAENRDRLRGWLKAAAIDTGVHYPIALPFLNAYRHLGHGVADFPNAVTASQQIVSLPMFAELTEEQMDYVVGRIHECMR